MPLPHLASRLYGTPLLVARSKLDIILSVLGERIHWPEPLAAIPLPPARAQTEAPPGIAVVPIHGTLVRRSLALDPASGLTSYAEIGAMLNAALADSTVAGILLDIDSPGGEAGGVFELARQIRAADAQKPVWAIASDSAYSAAYAIACSASRVYVTQTGGMGSIGVIAMHVDQSARDAQEGYRYTAITAGDQKNDFSPHLPLDKEASARLQSEVDRLYGIFVDHVAGMRQLEPRFVRSTQAGIYFGPEAVTAGLADAEGSPAMVIADFSAFLAEKRKNQFVLPGSPLAGSDLASSHPIPTKENRMSTAQENPTPTDTPVPTDAAPPVDAPTTPTPADPAPDPDEDTVKAAVAAARADAVAVAELCQLAGQPQRTAAFLAEGASESQVRKSLLAARAQSPEITSVIDPDAAAQPGSEASPERNPLMKAVKKLTGKD